MTRTPFLSTSPPASSDMNDYMLLPDAEGGLTILASPIAMDIFKDGGFDEDDDPSKGELSFDAPLKGASV